MRLGGEKQGRKEGNMAEWKSGKKVWKWKKKRIWEMVFDSKRKKKDKIKRKLKKRRKGGKSEMEYWRNRKEN